MAIIKPFPAIRPNVKEAEQIAALPYDVYNRQEAKEVVKGNPLSFLNIDRPETQFSDEQDMYADEVYAKAHDMFWDMVTEGHYVKDEKPCYYLYELTMDGRAQTGLVACASIDDYQNEVIKKHENTRAEKEKDRIRHVDTVGAQTGPIFLAYRAIDEINKLVDKIKTKNAVNDFVSDDGIRHRVWVIDEAADLTTIEEAFAKVGEIYIADGHHRCASAVKVGLKRREANPKYNGEEPFNYFLSVLFPDRELMIMDYNRVVKDLNGLSPREYLEQVKQLFTVSEYKKEKPQDKGRVSMYLEGKWYDLVLPKSEEGVNPVEAMDVSKLQKLLLEPVLGIKDPKTDERIDFVGGIRGLDELERRCKTDCKVAFAMYPTSISELFAVADASLLMPPKSTWFEPKLRSGLFIHEI
ncbi:DUF1015 domain-containing protein [Eubacterium oxidoreducens]|uniref:Uncharacterized conserved protein, DUF1015 family n=1 Tax=Eubacterium oxidoreducens TaxID=1732 RepID=A0A1G6AXU7_EUBOX|nr:DUF1015 domain-containing protein [Eubacterium oxidoreducens]SDB13200.1 Uncharacterized conserved protein, DUF1015 family [Eubacterium oxidoreducens]